MFNFIFRNGIPGQRTPALRTICFLAIPLWLLASPSARAQTYTGKPFSATAVNPVTAAPVRLYVAGSKVRADFVPPPGDPTAKNDLIYTLAFFHPRAFYQVSPHDHSCQSQVSLLPAKSLEDYLSGFSPSIDSLRSSAQGSLASHVVTEGGIAYTVLEKRNAAAGPGQPSRTRIWVVKDLGLVAKLEAADKAGKLQTTDFLTRIDLKKPDDALFAVPANCQAGH